MGTRARRWIPRLIVAAILLALVSFTYRMDTWIERSGAGGIAIGVPAIIFFVWRTPKPIVARIIIALVAAAAVALVLGLIVDHADATKTEKDMKALADYHKTNLRGALFGAFLSLGGFLFSLKTFIVVKMKEGVYDSKRYRKRLATMRAREPENAKTPIFGELDRLRQLLFASIVAAIVAGIAQVTIGAFENAYAAIVCIAAAAFVIALLVQALLLINSNLRAWFQELERAAVDKEKRSAEKPSQDAERSPQGSPSENSPGAA